MGNPYNQLTLYERYQTKALSELNYYSPETYQAQMAHDSAYYRRKKAAKAHKRNAELLPRKGKHYRQRKGIEAGPLLIPNRVDIDERPAYVDLNEEIGHWEGDTAYEQDGYLVTLTEGNLKTHTRASPEKITEEKSHSLFFPPEQTNL